MLILQLLTQGDLRSCGVARWIEEQTEEFELSFL
jgi:hypothetical protein